MGAALDRPVGEATSAVSERRFREMNSLWNLGVGILGGVVGSLLISIAVLTTTGYVRHPFEAFPWLLLVSVVPAGLGGLFLGLTRGPSWPLAALVGFVVVAASGSAGAIVVQSAQLGIDQVNMSGYLFWCLPYATALLPIATPLAYAGSRVARRQNT